MTPSQHSNLNNIENLCFKGFIIFLILQFVVWSILPIVIVKGMYVDVAENWEWGRHFQWGYDKDPYFIAWITYYVMRFTNNAPVISYFLSQISVLTAFLAIWRLALRMLPNTYAMLSVLILMLLYFYSFGSVEFNDDVGEIGLWALSILFFHIAINEQKYSQWLLVGLFTGLASIDKYFTLILLLSMLTFLFINFRARQSFKNKGIYTGLLVFLLLVLPNFFWLIKNKFVAISYAFHRASVTRSDFFDFVNHIINPLIFVSSMFVFVVIALLIMRGSFGKKTTQQLQISNDDRQFLYTIFFGPFVFSLSFLIITGAGFHYVWAMPMFNLLGIIVFAWWQPKLTKKNVNFFFIIMAVILFIWIVGFVFLETTFPHILKNRNHRFEFYPGKEIAETLTKAWHDKYHQPLYYAAGKREYVVYITHYSVDHPQGYFEWQPLYSQWIDEKDLRKKGALFVWRPYGGFAVPGDLLTRFPTLTKPIIFKYDWLFEDWLTKYFGFQKPEPLIVEAAFLPPAKT